MQIPFVVVTYTTNRASKLDNLMTAILNDLLGTFREILAILMEVITIFHGITTFFPVSGW